MSNRMNGKQAIEGALSLDAFIAGADAVESGGKDVQESEPKGRVGAPKKPKSEARSKVVQITLTEAEHAKLKREAGLVPVSVFLRNVLVDKNII